ncbi:MAG: aldehyde ferredoxin oxidoreductase family protein [Desulfatiglans sp.]|jgi:aldehyde:ferredoxin oxidoreductase|nr:aldehyde ferredoxin oxidoreductase family protein [Desulfatiglans sp.]
MAGQSSQDKNDERFGYHGKILIVDLSTGKIHVEHPPAAFYEDYLGGLGTGVKYLIDNMAPEVDPLGPDNILGFVPGILNGTNVPFGGRWTVVGKSPLTGTWGDANSGGFFGTELRKTGFDALFVKGISEEPVYLSINNDQVDIKPALDLWGMDTTEVEEKLEKDLGRTKVRVASIGPAGEKLSLISGIFNDKGRTAARSGLGAVMGSKRLKAVVVKGDQKIQIADPVGLKEFKKEALEPMKLRPSRLTKIMMALTKPILPWLIKKGLLSLDDVGVMVEGFGKHGTSMLAAASVEMGDAPCKNWSGGGSDDFPMKKASSKISDDNITKYKTKKFACQSCPLGCGAILKVDKGPYPLEETHRPEYETLAVFGSVLLNDDAESIIKANDICNRSGLDTISAGTCIAFAIECYENKILTPEETDGLELTWGNSEAILGLLEKIGKREGLGDILADGVRIAAGKIGRGAEAFAMHAGGQELPMHDPRLNPGFGTTYITDPTPGRHTQGGAGFLEFGFYIMPFKGIEMSEVERYQYSGKGEAHALLSKAQIVEDAMGICIFAGMFGGSPYAEMLTAIMGKKYTNDDLLKIGERVQILRQVFNVREGFKPSDFKLPDRVIGRPPLTKGLTAGVTVDVDTMAREFFEAMDWSIGTGKPSSERLELMGLPEIARELHGEGKGA